MSSPWTFLLYRYGNEVRSPTPAQIREAAHELFHERHPQMTEATYDEHGTASLRYGFDEGPMYVLEVTRSGLVRWEEWADQDYNEELTPVKELRGLAEQSVVDLWDALSNGQVEKVRGAFSGAS